MKKQSSMQVVLSLRRRHQDEVERTLAEALQRMQQAQQSLDVLRADLLCLRQSPAAKAGELLHMGDVQERTHRIRYLEEACVTAEAIIAECKSAVAQQQQAYLEARQAREVVDSLLKQRAQLEQYKQGKRDTKVSDDLFLGRFIRRDSGEDWTV